MSTTYRPLVPPTWQGVPDLVIGMLWREVSAKGMTCTWSKGVQCPCFRIATLDGSGLANQRSTEPQGDCPSCGGSGWLAYGSQSGTFLILDAQSALNRNGTTGLVQPGTVNVTALIEEPINVGDRITVDGNIRIVEQQFTRSSGLVDRLRFPIVNTTWTLGTSGNPTVPTTATVGVDVVFAASSSTGAIVGGATPTQYLQGTNFTVDLQGRIDWTVGGGSIPPAGAQCSIRYYAHPRYIVTADTFTHRQAGFVETGTKVERQLFWRGQAILESLGTAPT